MAGVAESDLYGGKWQCEVRWSFSLAVSLYHGNVRESRDTNLRLFQSESSQLIPGSSYGFRDGALDAQDFV